MKKTLNFREGSDKTYKSIHDVLSLEEMITIRGGGKVVDSGDDGGFNP
jgi:hypothetical protein